MDTTSSPTPHTPPRSRGWVKAAAVAVLVTLLLCAVAAFFLPLVWPVAPLEGAKQPMALRDKDSRFGMVDGTMVHFKLYGSKNASETILLLHGYGASTFTWREVAPVLGGQYKVVVMDRPGFGLTERKLPPSATAWQTDGPYSIRSQAELAYALLDQLGVSRATIVGHSQGAQVAVAMAAMSPQRVRALVLDAPDMSGSGTVPQWIAPVFRTAQGRTVGPLLVRRMAGTGIDALLNRAFTDPSKVTPAVVAGYKKPFRAIDWDKALWETAISPQPLRPQAALGQLGGIPTLVIVPMADRLVAPSAQLATAKAIPQARVRQIQGEAHLYHEEQPSQWVSVVVGFLDRALAQGQ